MSKWNDKYFDEIQELDAYFKRFYIAWNDIYIDYEKDRPYSLDRFKETVDEMLEAFSYFASELEAINESD